MSIAFAMAVAVVATLAAVGWVQRRDYDAAHLLDVEPTPFAAEPEPWPGYVPRSPERRRHWQVGTEQYDIENVIRRRWEAQP